MVEELCHFTVGFWVAQMNPYNAWNDIHYLWEGSCQASLVCVLHSLNALQELQHTEGVGVGVVAIARTCDSCVNESG